MSDNTRKKAVPADDDRNLVLVDGDFNEADLDDKIWLFWERNRGYLVFSAVAIFVAGLGYIGVQAFRAQHARGIGAAYAVAETPELKVGFAERHRGEPLAALAALEAADAAYAKSDYAEAARRYALAGELAALAGAKAKPVAVRAPVSAALCDLRAGREEAGLKQLEAIASAATADKAAKCHALFALAEHACGRKDFAKARDYLDRFDRDSAGAAGWASGSGPKAMLMRVFPELLAAEAPAAPVAPAAR